MTFQPSRHILLPKGISMSLPRETEAARLLREMRERDDLLKSALNLANRFKGLRNPLNDVQAHVDKLKQPLSQDLAKTLQDAPTLRAIDIARQLGAPAGSEPVQTMGPKSVPKLTETPVRTAADLGQMIRKARKTLKLNQADFAAHAGVGRRFISELEGGKGSLEFDKVVACAITAGIDIGARSRTS